MTKTIKIGISKTGMDQIKNTGIYVVSINGEKCIIERIGETNKVIIYRAEAKEQTPFNGVCTKMTTNEESPFNFEVVNQYDGTNQFKEIDHSTDFSTKHSIGFHTDSVNVKDQKATIAMFRFQTFPKRNAARVPSIKN